MSVGRRLLCVLPRLFSSDASAVCNAKRFVHRFSSLTCPLKCFKAEFCLNATSYSTSCETMKVLNVAEKNDAAKSIADLMSRGGYRRRDGFSRFNKIYEYNYQLFNQNCTMVMTSVSGHLLNHEFVGQYRKWQSCSPVALFDAPMQKFCPDDYKDIKRTLEREIRGVSTLIIWTDCDREGENIGFEVIQVCKAVKPNVRVLRAKFSEITPQAIERACHNLGPPDENTSKAVDARSELDLRIGAAFTRFQTLRLQKVFPTVLSDQLVSYGSCQFPTLGFVVERFKQVEAFIPEPFWKIHVKHQTEDGMAEFNWKRVKLFDHTAVLALYMHCLEDPTANVVDVRSKSKSRWRPVALDTVELEKLASRKLRISAKETMKIAEKLYTSGLISYPRTETNIFPKDFNLEGLIQNQTQDPAWGGFAAGLLQTGPTPRNGKKSDQAHPPIHPTKYANNLQGNEARIYEFVVRHFLACCSQDAQGMETTIEIDIAEERFMASGLMIIARNYLEVYPYDKWNAKVIPVMERGQSFVPTAIEMNQGETSPPSLLTEADLIALMEKHGIGTDATHADHIETIKSRIYVGVQNDGRFVPGELGIGLVDGYDNMGYQMSKPHLRAELEADLKLICEGRKDKDAVLQEQIGKYREVFVEAVRQADKLDEALAEYFGDARPITAQDLQAQVSVPVMPCSQCGQDMVLKTKKDGKGFFVSCMGFPDCKHAIWFPEIVLAAEITDQVCDICQPGPVHKLRLKFKRGSVLPSIPLDCIGCIAGCDPDFAEIFRRSRSGGAQTTNQNRSTNDSGYGSSFNSTASNHGSQNTTRGPSQGTLNNRNFNNSTNQNRNNSNFFAPRNPPSNNFHTGAHHTVNTGPAVVPGTAARMPFAPVAPSSNSSTASGGSGNSVVCNCGEDAKSLTVRKDGPNQGRPFYACSKPMDAGCGFFLWADEGNQNNNNENQPRQPNYNNQPRQPNYNNQDQGGWRSTARPPPGRNTGNTPKCSCGLDAAQRTVNKDGPNKGRPFYGCPKPMSESCRFFEWADENNNNTGGGYGGGGNPGPGRGRGGGGRGGGTGGGSKRKSSNSGQPGTKRRKCGLCGEEGHTRKTCKQI